MRRVLQTSYRTRDTHDSALVAITPGNSNSFIHIINQEGIETRMGLLHAILSLTTDRGTISDPHWFGEYDNLLHSCAFLRLWRAPLCTCADLSTFFAFGLYASCFGASFRKEQGTEMLSAPTLSQNQTSPGREEQNIWGPDDGVLPSQVCISRRQLTWSFYVVISREDSL